MVKGSRIGQGKGGGRPASITPEKTAILLAALENGFSLSEALAQAGISDDAYRRLLGKSEKFRGEITAAKMKLVMLARSKVALSINAGDMPTVRWFLERKVPEEFGRQAQEREDTSIIPQYIVLPGGRHPRITPDPNDPRFVYEDELAEHRASLGLRS